MAAGDKCRAISVVLWNSSDLVSLALKVKLGGGFKCFSFLSYLGT